MIRDHIQILMTFGILFALACKPAIQKTEPSSRQTLYIELNAALLQEKELTAPEKKIEFWKSYLSKPQFDADSVLKARISYNLAGVFYTMNNTDSARRYMQQSWDLMEKQTGFPDLKVLLYSGEGNLANIEAKTHQANYYYNQATILLGMDSVKLNDRQKAGIYLATAQSDAELYKYKEAIKWNETALQLSSGLDTPDARLLYRCYSQLALVTLSADYESKVIYPYIQKMEQLYLEHPDELSPRFLYDRKALYFDRADKADSAFTYRQKLLKIDREILDEQPFNSNHVVNYYIDLINISSYYTGQRTIDSAKYYLDQAGEILTKQGAALDPLDQLLYRKNYISYLYAKGSYKQIYTEQAAMQEAYRELIENEYAQSVAQMSTIYQLQAKERSISRLSDKVDISETKLKQNRLFLVIVGLSALLGITIAVLFYVIMKQRKIRQEKDKIKFQRNAIDLEQRLLRTQIEPHFIFNTLAALQSYIRLDEKEKSLKFLSQFSKLLRNSLEISREHLVPLSQEADVLANYLSLQQMRYEDSFSYQLLLPAADIAAEVLIPPMLIQPFVENAIIHGVNQIQEKGLIKIEMIVQQDHLLVQITDNGPGVDATANKKNQNKSLSTAISRERLAIIAKETQRIASIKVADRKQMNPSAQGTFVEIIIPI